MDRQVKGILGEKLGMTQVWDNGKVVPVTVVQAGPCVVTQVRTPDNDGYSAVQLAWGQIDPRKVNKPRAGHFAKADVAPRRHLVELRTTDAGEYSLGQEVTADTFAVLTALSICFFPIVVASIAADPEDGSDAGGFVDTGDAAPRSATASAGRSRTGTGNAPGGRRGGGGGGGGQRRG